MRTQHRRGYILLEAMVGGAITFAALVGLFVQLGFAREQSIVLQRDATAREIAMREIENQRANGFGSASGCPSSAGAGTLSTSAWTPVTGLTGTYDMRIARLCATEQVTTAIPLFISHKLVTVTVRFPTAYSPPREVAVTTRIYDR